MHTVRVLVPLDASARHFPEEDPELETPISRFVTSYHNISSSSDKGEGGPPIRWETERPP